MTQEGLQKAGSITRSQYLTFHLGSEDYGIEILNVKEIIQYSGVTSVPRTPDYVLGVINLRGNVVPVLDLLNLFGEDHIRQTKRTCIIIVEIEDAGEAMQAGLIVDEVDEVIGLGPDEIEKAPSFGSGTRTRFIKAMGKLGERFIILLDLTRIIAPDELHVFKDEGGGD